MPTPTIKYQLRTGREGDDRAVSFEAPPHSTAVTGGGVNGAPRPFSFMSSRTNFAELPSTAVGAATDKLLIHVGTGTEVVARSTTALGRGVTLTTQATTPTAADNVLLTPAANTGLITTVSALTGYRMATRVSLASVADIIASFGLSENVSDPDPTGTAGEGAMFLADPGEAVTTGLTTAQHANWILAYKVNGVDTFAATSVPLVADAAYDLDCVLQPDLTVKMYINNVLVGTSPALTDGDTIQPFLALETTTSAQKSMSVRFVEGGPTYVV